LAQDLYRFRKKKLPAHTTNCDSYCYCKQTTFNKMGLFGQSDAEKYLDSTQLVLYKVLEKDHNDAERYGWCCGFTKLCNGCGCAGMKSFCCTRAECIGCCLNCGPKYIVFYNCCIPSENEKEWQKLKDAIEAGKKAAATPEWLTFDSWSGHSHEFPQVLRFRESLPGPWVFSEGPAAYERIQKKWQSMFTVCIRWFTLYRIPSKFYGIHSKGTPLSQYFNDQYSNRHWNYNTTRIQQLPIIIIDSAAYL